MARTKRQELERRYRDQLEAAKEDYKEEKGLKVARGFMDSPEAKRILRNRYQALYRYERRKAIEEAQKLEKPKPGEAGPKVIADNAVFHTVLGYNSDLSRQVRNAFIEKQILVGDNKKVKLATFLNGKNIGVYYDPHQADEALRHLYNLALEAQAEANDGKGEGDAKVYPTITALEGINADGDYLFKTNLDTIDQIPHGKA
jgi:hypothetical protein